MTRSDLERRLYELKCELDREMNATKRIMLMARIAEVRALIRQIGNADAVPQTQGHG